MTSLACWLSVDRGPSAIYLASDSRISWGAQNTWDYGRKLFASHRFPEIFGYCGDVLFPSQVLGQIIELIDAGFLVIKSNDPAERFATIGMAIRESLSRYPSSARKPFSIIYCTRINNGMSSVFSVAVATTDASGTWKESWPNLPQESDVIIALGSGATSVEQAKTRWNEAMRTRTSRAVFSAFCDAIASGSDPLSGGPPQAVGIYREGVARSFGIIHEGRRYLFGLPFELTEAAGHLEWRNNLFECCGPVTMKLMTGAQRHARPKSLDPLRRR